MVILHVCSARPWFGILICSILIGTTHSFEDDSGYLASNHKVLMLAMRLKDAPPELRKGRGQIGDLLSQVHNAIESYQQKPEHTSEHSTRIAVDILLPLSTLKLHYLVSRKKVH